MKLYTISFTLSERPIYIEASSFLERHARSRQQFKILTTPLKLQSQEAMWSESKETTDDPLIIYF